MGKRTAQKDTIIDITSDSQVNSNFPYRWSPANLTFNNYFYLFFIFIYNVNNHKQQRATSKITKEPKQKSRLGTASNKNYWGASTSGSSPNISTAIRSIGNPLLTISIGALLVLSGSFRLAQMSHPPTYAFTSFCTPGK